MIAILDADKQGFLRSTTALIQTCGRAARNSEGRVIMYADVMTDAIKQTLAITEERRSIQIAYNKEHGITPTTVKRDISPLVAGEAAPEEQKVAEKPARYMTVAEVEKKIKAYEQEMRKAAKEMRFEDAARYRDLMREYQNFELEA